MSLIVIKDINEIEDWIHKSIKYFRTTSDILKEFCDELAMETALKTGKKDDFLTDKAVTKYLNSFGIKYKGNYMLELANWGAGVPFHRITGEQFVTVLNYTLQLGCLVSYHPEWITVLYNKGTYKGHLNKELEFDVKFFEPILKQRDIYLRVDSYYDLDPVDLSDAKKLGCEIIIEGHSSNEFSDYDYREFLDDLEERDSYLTRELDAEVFDESKVFKADKMLLSEYVVNLGEDDQRYFAGLCEKNPALKETMYIQNGKNNFNESSYRCYPLHMLLFINGEWKYHSTFSYKWPTFIDLLNEAVLNPETHFSKMQKDLISSATKIFTLVLNADEVCNVREYWKYMCCIIKYDKEANTVELCNKDEGLLEFHRLLQESTDLIPDFNIFNH